MSKPGTAPIDSGTTQEPAGNHLGTGERSGTPHPLKGGGGRNRSKFATKQARNRELNRRKKLAKHHRSGAKHSPETIERIRASRQAQEREREAARLEEAQRVVAPELNPAVQLYRETKAERMPVIKARDAEILEAVRKAVAEADARADEMRHRGRPKKKALPPIFIHRSPDALIAAVSDWHGER